MSEYLVAQALSFLTGQQGVEAGIIPVTEAGFIKVTQGDVNGDGVSDFLAAAPVEGGGVKVYVIFGGPGVVGPNSIDINSLNGSNGFVIEIDKPVLEGVGPFLNSSVQMSVDDMDGDGIPDIHITVTHPGSGDAYNEETTYHVLGQKSWSTSGGTFNVSNLVGTNGHKTVLDVSAATYDDTATGDVDGDGFNDSVHTYDYGYDEYSYGTPSGAYVVLDQSVSSPTQFDGTNGFRIFVGTDVGPVLAATGDFNNDGIDDVVLTAPLDDANGTNAGAAYVVFGSELPFPVTFDVSTLDGLNGFAIDGAPANAEMGGSVSNIGDFNGDGIDDICVGAPGADECYVVFGTAGSFGPGGCDVSTLDGTNGCVIQGINVGDECGYSVCGAGDWNGDGFDDLIVGAPGANGDTGECYVVFGRATCPAVIQCSALDGNNGFTIIGENPGDRAGSCVDPGDFTGDGFADVGLSAPGAGSAYVIYGGKPAEAVNRVGSAIGQTIRGGDLADTLSGLGGDDKLVGYGGNDSLDGGTGSDTADFSDKTGQIVATLNGATPVTVTVGGSAQDTIRDIENLIGGTAADSLTGDGFDNTFQGRLGKDTVDGMAGIDTIDLSDKTGKIVLVLDGANIALLTVGNVEDDRIRNIENAIGGSGDDLLNGDGFSNVLSGGAGNDQLVGDAGGSSSDTLIGGTGSDVLSGGDGLDVMDGGSGLDTADYSYLFGGIPVVCTLAATGDSTVTVNGLAEDTIRNIENLTGSSGNDRFTGNGLANVIRGGFGNDTLSGAGGIDTVVFEGQAIVVTLNGGANVVATADGIAEDTIRGFENVISGGGADSLTGDGLANSLNGGSGDDTLTGAGGKDTIEGGTGIDSLNGGDSDDRFVDGTGNDTMDGGTGVDELSYGERFKVAGATIVVTLNGASDVTVTINGTAEDTIRNIENLSGGVGHDTFTGDGLANVLNGGTPGVTTSGTGNDSLSGMGGNDTLDGGNGNDTLRGGLDNDVYIVDAGDNIAELANQGTDEVRSFLTRALGANFENLTLLGGGDVNGTGNGLDNLIIGNAGDNALKGGVGADTLKGGDGDDTYTVDAPADVVTELTGQGIDTIRSSVTKTLAATIENLALLGAGAIDGTGNASANRLTGNSADNTLTGKAGADVLRGKGGADRFDFNAVGESGIGANRDVIADFQAGGSADFVDRIDLSTIDANATLGGNQAFTFVGQAGFQADFVAGKGQVRAVKNGTATIISGEVDGDRVADFQIVISNDIALANLTGIDFVL